MSPILDYNMPGRDGLALAEELRARFPTMPIAVATANVQDEIIARARAANAPPLSPSRSPRTACAASCPARRCG
jgi:CheY-like chemotaxis protein